MDEIFYIHFSVVNLQIQVHILYIQHVSIQTNHIQVPECYMWPVAVNGTSQLSRVVAISGPNRVKYGTWR